MQEVIPYPITLVKYGNHKWKITTKLPGSKERYLVEIYSEYDEAKAKFEELLSGL